MQSLLRKPLSLVLSLAAFLLVHAHSTVKKHLKSLLKTVVYGIPGYEYDYHMDVRLNPRRMHCPSIFHVTRKGLNEQPKQRNMIMI